MQVRSLGGGRSPGGGHGSPLQCSCLENPVGRGAWRATVHGVAESDMTERLSGHARARTQAHGHRRTHACTHTRTGPS